MMNIRRIKMLPSQITCDDWGFLLKTEEHKFQKMITNEPSKHDLALDIVPKNNKSV